MISKMSFVDMVACAKRDPWSLLAPVLVCWGDEDVRPFEGGVCDIRCTTLIIIEGGLNQHIRLLESIPPSIG